MKETQLPLEILPKAKREREKHFLFPFLLPSSLLPVLLLAKSNQKPVGKVAREMRLQGAAPCDREVSRKGQGMGLSDNRPTTGTRHPLHLALTYFPFLISTTPAACTVVSSHVR